MSNPWDSTSSLQMKIERPLCDWKAAMSRLVMRSTTRTALVTKVIWSCSSPRNLITCEVKNHAVEKSNFFDKRRRYTFKRASIIPQETRASPPAS